ncbi:MAG: plastocyanin/azurin family copper-binding protein [Thermoleophilaceae bacterium]
MAPAGAPAHPGHGPTQVTIGSHAFQPQRVEVVTGDTVLWFWDGPDTNHSVTAAPGQAESFDSDPGRTPSHPVNDGFAHRFTEPGTFSYVCKVHSFMRGTVVATGEPVSDDVEAPVISSLRARPSRVCRRRSRRCRATSTRISFRLSEAASVRGRVVGRGARTVRRLRVEGRSGSNSVRIRGRGLRRGLYTVVLVASDEAGNASSEARVRLRVL